MCVCVCLCVCWEGGGVAGFKITFWKFFLSCNLFCFSPEFSPAVLVRHKKYDIICIQYQAILANLRVPLSIFKFNQFEIIRHNLYDVYCSNIFKYNYFKLHHFGKVNK